MRILPGQLFLVFRLARVMLLLVLLLALLLGGGLGLAGRLNCRESSSPSVSRLRQALEDRLGSLESYYLRCRVVPVGSGERASFLVEIWRSLPDRSRVEVTRLEGREQVGLQVLVMDGSRAYYYDPSLGDFYAVRGRDPVMPAPSTTLEQFWTGLLEAPRMELLAESTSTRHRYYVFEVHPLRPHRHCAVERVWLEADSLLPVRVESYDEHRRLTQVAVFELLQVNPVLAAALFEVGDLPLAGAPNGR